MFIRIRTTSGDNGTTIERYQRISEISGFTIQKGEQEDEIKSLSIQLDLIESKVDGTSEELKEILKEITRDKASDYENRILPDVLKNLTKLAIFTKELSNKVESLEKSKAEETNVG